MESLFWAGLSVILLVPILYFLPVGLKVSGKFILIAVAFFLASIGLLAKLTLPVWQAGLIVVVLACLVGYLLDTRLGKLFYLATRSQPKRNVLVIEEERAASLENGGEQVSAESQIEMGVNEAGASGEHETEEDIRLEMQRATREYEEWLSEPALGLAEVEVVDVPDVQEETNVDDAGTIAEWSVAPDSYIGEAEITEADVLLENRHETSHAQALDEEEAGVYIAEVELVEADVLPDMEQEMSFDQERTVEEQIEEVAESALANEEPSYELDEDLAFFMEREQVATLLPDTDEPISGHHDVQFEATHYMSEIEKMLEDDDSDLNLGVIAAQQAVSPVVKETPVVVMPTEVADEFELATISFDDAHIEADHHQVENDQLETIWGDDEIEPLHWAEPVVEAKHKEQAEQVD